MTVHFPTFRSTIADQMAAYRERLAERISKELHRRGEDHRDLAAALKADPRTAERWTTGETEPQRRYRKPIADYFAVPIEELWPELELEDKAFREQLDRIEAELRSLSTTLASLDARLTTKLDQLGRGQQSGSGAKRTKSRRAT